MDDRTLLSELAQEVKEAEREELLKKLKSRQQHSLAESSTREEVLKEIQESEEKEKKTERRGLILKQKYEKFSLMQKFFVFCKQLFKRIDFTQAVEMTLLDNLNRSLSAPPRPVITFDGLKVTNVFVDQVALLQESLNQLKGFLTSFDGSDEPGEFYFFAFGELFPDTALKFRDSVTLSHFLTEEISDVSVIRRQLNDEFNQFVTKFPRPIRERLDVVSKDLKACRALCAYPFRNLINKLILNTSVSSVADELKDLAVVFSDFNVRQNCDFFVLLISYNIKKAENRDRFNRKEMMGYLNSLLNSIYNFRKIIPIEDLAAFALKDTSFLNRSSANSSDDWFFEFRNHVFRYRDRLIDKYSHLIQLNNLTLKMKEIYGLDSFPYLKGYVNEVWSDVNVTVVFEKTLAFCKFFISSQMNGISAVVKPMLAEGLFYKQENKTALSNVYNKTRSTLEYINEIEKMFSKNGSIFKNLKAACSLTDAEILNSNSGFLHNIIDMKEVDISREIQEFIVNLDVLEKLFTGFLYGESSESYDTVSNLKSFKTVNNKEFIKNSKKLIESVREAKTVLSDFYNIEKLALKS